MARPALRPTFAADAQLEGLIVDPSRGFAENVYLERPDAPTCIVVHTTGNGPNKRYLNKLERARFRYAKPFEAARRIYREVMKAGPHYVCGAEGERAQVCPERLAAWHVGSLGSNPYSKPNGSWADPNGEHDWWFKAWGPYGLTSPFELASGTAWTLPKSTKPFRMGIRTGFAKHSCNDNAIGWEVVPRLEAPRGPWGTKCWESLAEGIYENATRLKIPLSPLHIFDHSDAHPLARTANGEGWDTGPAQWSWKRFAEVAGIPA